MIGRIWNPKRGRFSLLGGCVCWGESWGQKEGVSFLKRETWHVWLLGQSILELSVAQGVEDGHDLDLNINRDHLLIKEYLRTKFWSFWGKVFLSYQLHKVWEMDITIDLDPWPHLNINRDHLLIKDYILTKFEVSWAKPSWVISCTRLGETDIPTDMRKAICPSFFQEKHGCPRRQQS